MRHLFVFVLLALSVASFAQKSVRVFGTVRSEQGQALPLAEIKVANSEVKISSTDSGTYSLSTSYKPFIILYVSRDGFQSERVEIRSAKRSEIRQDFVLRQNYRQLSQVEVRANTNRTGNLRRINPTQVGNMPVASGNFESILKTLPGVSANNELSSQYSVRGGNFNENLIYINDVEIFRPLLVRNGQQEGLSFINPELVSQAHFSAGGFDARYGEKLSSVLDIRYNRPDSQQTVLSAGLLGLSATSKLVRKRNFTLIGFRTKTNQSILKTQPVVGSYQPRFYDLQALHSSRINSKLDATLFADYNLSRFELIPESRETTFGTLNEQYKLKVDYEGAEKDRYESIIGAVTFAYRPVSKLLLKWINSAFIISEKETYDIEGRYIFDQPVDPESTSGFENVRAGRGEGIDYNYARNFLQSRVYSSELRGYYKQGRSDWEAGVRYQYDVITDELNEYNLTDSAGYSLPYNSPDFLLTEAVFSNNKTYTRRYSGFLQNTYSWSSRLHLNFGIRGNFNSYTKETLVSPRVNFLYSPTKKLSLKFSAGSYNQPPFYRELRDYNGNLNNQSRAQRSLHFLTGADYSFVSLGTPLKFSSEIYYKKLSHLIPYKVENLRIRYFAGQEAVGYAAGIDLSLSGEFVPGLESSFRVSLMKTEEDITGDSFKKKDADGNTSVIYPGYLKRPTDQRINFSAFFQDRLFNSPTYKVHLTMLYGSALPVGPPRTERYADTFRIPAYRRVDIGFSKNILEGSSGRKLGFAKKYFETFQLYAEVFNLLNINNTVSYFWIKDINNYQYAIPNYLTSRQVNFKIIAKIKNR
ncbi:TonB-dependent receptor [Desertivirga brevis]|uniref:TonB-dependent receptor n=1 Tax=Desertivirga brevis TaxID=2810310 RepID=UPI001A96809A|nr:TonB-dependent receptor [Pedobacter sp. SYSU D00873]